MPVIGEFHVMVKFGSGIQGDAQGRTMLALEKHLREITGSPVEVFKETMNDDSRLRAMMTREQRAKL